jgi:hypothetical protein
MLTISCGDGGLTFFLQIRVLPWLPRGLIAASLEADLLLRLLVHGHAPRLVGFRLSNELREFWTSGAGVCPGQGEKADSDCAGGIVARPDARLMTHG